MVAGKGSKPINGIIWSRIQPIGFGRNWDTEVVWQHITKASSALSPGWLDEAETHLRRAAELKQAYFRRGYRLNDFIFTAY